MNRGGRIPLWVFFAVLAWLQFYVRPRFVGVPWAPDFLLIALLVHARRQPPGPAAIAGFMVGLLVDVLAPTRFGAAMLAHTTVAYLGSRGRTLFYADTVLEIGRLFFVGTMLRNVILLAAAWGIGSGVTLPALGGTVLLQSATTAVAGTLVMLAIRRWGDRQGEP